MPSRFQDSENLRKCLLFVWTEIDNTVANDYICLVINKWHMLNISLAKLYIVQIELVCIYASLLNHILCEVQANDFTLFST